MIPVIVDDTLLKMSHIRFFLRCVVVGALLLGPAVLSADTTAAVPVKETGPDPALEPLVMATDGRPGGRLVVALGAEPRTLNPLLAIDRPSFTVVRRLHGSLVRIDGISHRSIPALATGWQHLDGGRRLRLKLRRGVRFSDGAPFTADDVVFTFQVYLDPDVGSPNRDLLIVQGEPIRARKVDSHTVDLEFAAPYAVGERLLDGLAILPRHRLQAAYAAGEIQQRWGLDSRAEDIVGLGPFRFNGYLPGERLDLERNPHYWKVDGRQRPLPYLDHLTFVFAANPESQVVRFEQGATHLISPLSSESFSLLQKSRKRAEMVLEDVGPGLAYNFLFFNLNPVDAEVRPDLAAKQGWFRQRAFRQAVSAAIDRQALIRLVYRGRATAISSHVTSGNRLWINRQLAPPQRSLDGARNLLRRAGFSWRADGRLVDDRGQSVSFTLITSSSNAQRLDMATIIERDLDELGIEVIVVPLEFRTLIDRLTQTFDYEASLLALGGGDVDPNSVINVMKSDGGNHLWHLRQTEPATPWEAEIDRLLTQQLITLDASERKRLYDRVQQIVAEELPFIFLLSPNILVGARHDVGNFEPSILGHPTLWNVDRLYLRSTPQP